MTRTAAALVNSYLAEPVLEFRQFAQVTFSNTTMRLWTGVGSFMVGATHYDGIGVFGGVERVTEGEALTSPVRLWLSAVHSGAMQEAINETLFGKQVSVYRGYLRNGTLVNTLELWYSGQMGKVDLHRGDPERGNYIEVNLQTKIERERRPSYYTAEDLSLSYSGDTFFNYLDQIPTKDAQWGQRPTRFSGYQPYKTYGGKRFRIRAPI